MVRFSESSAARDPDVQLMLQLRGGSHAAFEKLLARYQDRVRGIITYLMGDAKQADDLTQEVFLRVFRARKSYVVGAKFSTWLFTIVNHVVSNARRTLARRHEVSMEHEVMFTDRRREVCGPVSSESAPDWNVEQAEVREVVRGCINRLGERQRRAITLCDLDGMSYANVAQSIGTSTDAAKSLIHRGRSNLKRMLESHVQRGNVL